MKTPFRPNISASLAFVLLALLVCSCSGGSGGSADAGDGQPRNEEASIPEVVPYLDTKPSEVDGGGSAVLRPSNPLPVGTRANFEIVFTVGEHGIAPGGFVMLQVSPWWGWTPPQTLDTQRPGFTTVTTSAPKPSLEVRTLQMNRILVFSKSEAFAPGEQVTFRYGNNPQVDKFAEEEELFQLFVDADGDGHSACIENPPTIQTLAREAIRLNVSAPSQVTVGETIRVSVAPLDALGNWSWLPGGEYRLAVIHGEQTVEAASVTVDEGRKKISFSHTLDDEGIYFFSVQGPGLEGRSNVTLCQQDAPRLNLYFGDIHGHSRMSDGSGTPEDYYRYARDVSRLDIAALTDHADYGTIPIKGEAWARIKQAANDAYDPGAFVTYVAFEWTSWVYGHRNVYYRDGSGPVFRSIDPESDTPQEIWNLIRPYEAMTVAHHVGGGPIATDWSIAPGDREWLVEICSIHGSSEYYGGEAAIYNPQEGAFVRDTLAKGYKLGIIASGDTHDGHPGQRSAGSIVNGTVAVYSAELTREAIWEAFRRRHVYGTSGPKIILNFRVADSPMGSEVAWKASQGPLSIAVRAIGCDDIAAIQIIRNGEVVFAQPGDGVFVQFLLGDPGPPSGRSWYYARILQDDGNMAWSSPVWVTVE